MDVYVVVSNPFVLPFSWKNGISKLVLVGRQEGDEEYYAQDTKVIDNGGATHVSGVEN